MFSVNDTVAFATPLGIGTAKIKALLKPKEMQELLGSASKFYYVDTVSAASGVKISGSGFEGALPGSLIVSTTLPNYEKEIKSEIEEVFATDKSGIILKTDTIGSLEALSKLMKSAGISIGRKGIGTVAKHDVLDAFAMKAINPYGAVVVAFNIGIEEDAKAEAYATGTDIISGDVIYKVIDDYKAWFDNEKTREKEAVEKVLVFPAKIKVLPNHRFRISHPAVFGIEIMSGRIKPSVQLMNVNGEILGVIREVQNNGMNLQEAKKGESIAISMDDVTLGRQINDNDILYTFLNDDEMRLLRYKFTDMLDDEEKDLLDETQEVKGKRRGTA